MQKITLSDLAKISKYQGAILATVLVLAVFMMILPLPTEVVDVLIAFNLMFSLVLLMVVVYLNSAVEFSVFPSLLLITTLYRLSLTVSTSRLILLQHDAGNIVSAFGNFVVGGNLTVGLIIFSIITIVQFIVITKGSERVAEVSARFSLDGMPGKQMSIDGDLRAGSITAEQAAMRREMVQHESKLYGSMDGAMKFVKGDAIASIIIILVNIFGGMAIGVMHEGMRVSDALSTYSILSVGDGLVAQIPALLISITAGVLVTRVPGAKGKTNLASELFHQLGGRSMPLMIASSVLVIFAFIPGFPAAVFLPMAALIGLVSYLVYRRGDHGDDTHGAEQGNQDRTNLSPGVEPLLVRVHSSINEADLADALEALRWRFFENYRLSSGEPPVASGFPPSVFAMLPRLLERAGNGRVGSITAFYTVLVEGDNMNEPIADEVRSILDGHIVLSRKLAEANHYPAIDVSASVSRVMRQIVDSEHIRLAGHLRTLMALYREIELLVRVGEYREGQDPDADQALRCWPAIQQFLQQPAGNPQSLSETLELLKLAVE